MKKYLSALLFFALQTTLSAQTADAHQIKPSFGAFDGVAVAGYVDKGAFLNFTGPNISLTVKRSRFILGMLPSLRFKEDEGTYRNSFVTPNLGAGLTYCYRKFAVQVPVYYNAKTAATNGKWNVGIGIGVKLK